MNLEIAYLNNSATSYPKPDKVITATNSYINSVPFHSSRAGHEQAVKNPVENCRKRISQLFNISNPSSVILTSSATEALNIIVRGLRLENAHVITTSIEHNSVLRPLKHLEVEFDLQLTVVECDEHGFVYPYQFDEAIRDNTKAIFVNHCSNVTGSIIDIESISDIVRKRDIIFVVDVSQSAGIIPIDVKRMGIDILVFTGHKYLYGLPGTGGFYINEDIVLNQYKVGGTGIRSDLLLHPEDIPIRYEAGTYNIPGIVSLANGVEFVIQTGIDTIQKRCSSIIHSITEYFAQKHQLKIYRTNDKAFSSLCSFNIMNMSPSDVGYIMEETFNIIVRTGLHCAPLIHRYIGSSPEGTVRISPSYFTKDKHIEMLIDAIDGICKMF